jgi:pyruvate dehydrogenase E2 component (dihydrolipoamide acetyltransferase)
MANDLLMPKLGLTMTEGLIQEWKVAPGEPVSEGQVVFVVETDKIATEVEAERGGVLVAQLVAEGETVPVGTPVGRLSAGDGTGTGSPATHEAPSAARAQTRPQPSRPRSVGTGPGARIIATPLARRRARELSVDLSSLRGTGPRGRIKAIDVERSEVNAPPAMPDIRPPPSVAPAHPGTRAKPSPIQAAMARRLAEVKQGVPHFYLSTEVEVSKLVALRSELNQDRSVPAVTLNHLLLAATGRALGDHPGINRVWQDGEVFSFAALDVAMAVETEAGLFVPVLREAGRKALDRIVRDARDLMERARAGALGTDDMTGGAIAVSNAGMHGVTWLTPIINPGHSAILGVGSIREVFRPDEQGRPALRREIGIVFSGDHRVHTGIEALRFLNCVKAYLERPMRLLRVDEP